MVKSSEIPRLLDDYLRIVVDGGWAYDRDVLELMHEVAAGQTITTLSRQNNIKRTILNGYIERAERAVQDITADRVTEYRAAQYLPVTPFEVRDMVARGEVKGEPINGGRSAIAAKWIVSLREVRDVLQAKGSDE